MIYPPTFFADVSENEKKVIFDIKRCLSALSSVVTEMDTSLDIFDCASTSIAQIPQVVDYDDREAVDRRAAEHIRFGRWWNVAARNAAIAIYEHYQVSQLLNNLCSKSPWMKARYDKSKLKEGRKLFETFFPEFANLRNAAAHFGTSSADPIERDINSATDSVIIPDGLSIIGERGTISISNCVSGRNYSFTLEGKLVSLEISQKTLDQLVEITELKFDAFRNMRE